MAAAIIRFAITQQDKPNDKNLSTPFISELSQNAEYIDD
jgi:hypothetical protein